MLARTKRRITAIVMAGALALALSGCYTMKTENVYHADGTVDSTILIAMDDTVLAEQFPDSSDPAQAFVDQATSGPNMGSIQEQLGDRLTFERYAQDGQSGLVMKMTGVTLDEVATLNAQQGAPAGETSFTDVDGRITLDYMADAGLMANYADALSSAEASGLDSSALSTYVDFEARHTFPGRVISTTIGRVDPENPNSVIITDLTDMASAQHYTIVASDRGEGANDVPLLWIVIVGLVALTAVAGVIILRIRATRSADPTPPLEAVETVLFEAQVGDAGAPATPASPEGVEE